MVQNDENGDSVLTATDFQSLINDVSRGKINLDMETPIRTPLHEVFDLRLDEQLSGVDVAAAKQEATPAGREGLELFCENVYQSLFPLFNVSVTREECNQALAFYDEGYIDADEFADLASTLTGQIFDSYEALGNSTRDVFEDFEGSNETIEGTLLGSRPQLPHLLCRRVVLGTRIDGNFAANVPEVPSSPTQSPPAVVPSCLSQLEAADDNGDGLLSQTEYLSLLNFLSPRQILFESFEELPILLRNNYIWLRFGGDEVDIGGINAPNASERELRHLDWICSQTESSLNSPPSLYEEAPSLIECLIESLYADVNSDGVLTIDEFTSLVAGTNDVNVTGSMIEELLEAFNSVSEGAAAIDITGAGRYVVPSEDSLLRFEILCDIVEDLSQGAMSPTNRTEEGNFTLTPTIVPMEGNLTQSPTPAPIEGNFTQIPNLPPQTATPSGSYTATLAPSVESTNVSLAPADPNVTVTLSPTSDATLAPTSDPSTNDNATDAPGNQTFTLIPTVAPTVGNFSMSPSNAPFPPTGFTPTLSPSLGNSSSSLFPFSTTNSTFSPTISPSIETTLTPSGVMESTIPPTLAVDDYRLCTQSMLLCDRNRDNLMQTDEFVTACLLLAFVMTQYHHANFHWLISTVI